jgi:hypothetical protein
MACFDDHLCFRKNALRPGTAGKNRPAAWKSSSASVVLAQRLQIDAILAEKNHLVEKKSLCSTFLSLHQAS